MKQRLVVLSTVVIAALSGLVVTDVTTLSIQADGQTGNQQTGQSTAQPGNPPIDLPIGPEDDDINWG
jgi:hypothetical protein